MGYAKQVRKEGRDYTVGVSCESPTAIVAPMVEPKIERLLEEEDQGMKIRRLILEVRFLFTLFLILVILNSYILQLWTGC